MADLRFAYDSGAHRVLKTATDADGHAVFTVQIFDSLRLTHARWDGDTGDYERSASTEAVYLAGMARVVHLPPSVEATQNGTQAQQRVFLTIADHLGSTSAIVDRDTGELVERTTYEALGRADSDYRPARWGSFREEFRFTGKEEDEEVGLTSFGTRYFSPALGRWISADPMTIHELGADPNPYAYVGGQAMNAIDPDGLDLWRDLAKFLGFGDDLTGSSTGTSMGTAATMTALGEVENVIIHPIGPSQMMQSGDRLWANRGGSTWIPAVFQEEAVTVRAQAPRPPTASKMLDVARGVRDAAVDGASSTADAILATGRLSHGDALGAMSAMLDGPVAGILAPIKTPDAEQGAGYRYGYWGATIATMFIPVEGEARGLDLVKTGATAGLRRLLKGTSYALGKALEKAGHSRQAGDAAHHLVASRSRYARKTREILARLGIDIDEAANGVLLPKNTAEKIRRATDAAAHSRIHTKAYYKAVEELLQGATTREQGMLFLESIAEALLKGGFP